MGYVISILYNESLGHFLSSFSVFSRPDCPNILQSLELNPDFQTPKLTRSFSAAKPPVSDTPT